MEPAVLHLGMGCDSSKLLTQYLDIPAHKRPFELRAVLMSQTGDESTAIKNQIEECIYPFLASEGIRTVQIARKSSSLKDKFVVLDDTTNPTICHIRPTTEKPYFTLSDDLLLAATVPQFAAKRRKCSFKFKGQILDAWHAANCPGCKKIIGFNGEEGERVQRSLAAGSGEHPLHPAIFPLYEQGDTRLEIETFLFDYYKRRFYRSACTFCPFSIISGDASEIKEKYDMYPHEAARAAYLEYVSICFNSKQTLSSSGKTLIERKLLSNEAIDLFNLEVEEATWKLYKVRRMRGLNQPYRSVEIVSVGTRDSTQAELEAQSIQLGTSLQVCDRGIRRLHIEVAEDCEEFLVAAPGDPANKERPQFQKIWRKRQQQKIILPSATPMNNKRRTAYCGSTFTAIRGTLSVDEIFTAMVPVSFLVKNFEYTTDQVSDELYYQRELNLSHAQEIADYISDSPRFFFSSIVASIEGDWTFEPMDEQNPDIGRLFVPDTAIIRIHDGQHRRAGWDIALKANPQLARQTMPVVLYQFESIEQVQQMFKDLNFYGVRANSALEVLFEHRDREKVLTRKIVQAVPLLKRLTEMKKNTIAAKAGQLFTIKNLHDINSQLFQPLASREDDEILEIGVAFWEALCSHMPRWQLVFQGKLSASDVRRDDVSCWAVMLFALGKVGQAIISRHLPNLEKVDSALAGLEEIDWSRDNPDWQDIFIFQGKIINNAQTKKGLSIYLKRHLGVALTDDEQRFDDAQS